MTKEITRRNLNDGLLAFVDMLGFSARVEGMRSEIELLGLDADVAFVQEQFEHKSPDSSIKQSHKLVRKSVLAFSDCLVISVPLRSQLTKLHGAFDVLMSELTSFALAQGACVIRGIFLRGGVDLGFWFRRKDSLISPAMVRAYRLEHDACVPMIAITPELRKYLAMHPDRRFYSEAIDPFRNTFKQYRKLPNGKGQWFINYVKICLESVEPIIFRDDRKRYQAEDRDGRERMRTKAWRNACREWARRHGQVVLAAHKAAEEFSVREKYAWLANYHNVEIRRFFGKGAEPLLINLEKQPDRTIL